MLVAMNREGLERNVNIILSQVPLLPLNSWAFGEYTPAVEKPTSLSAILVDGAVARPGDYELTGEQITLLVLLSSQNSQLETDHLEDLLLRRLDNGNAHVITITLIALRRLGVLRQFLLNATPELQIRLCVSFPTR
jgi:hypothetical protein